MEVEIRLGSIQEIASELIVVNLFQGVEQPGGATGAVDRALGGAITELIAAGDFRGKLGETAVLYPRGAIPARRVMVVGLGERASFNAQAVRRAAASAAQAAQRLGVRTFHTILHGAGAGGVPPAEAAQAIVEGTILGTYAFTGYGAPSPDRPAPIERMAIVLFGAAQQQEVEEGARAGRIIAESTCFVRDLVNRPANYMTPAMLAQAALAMAQEVGLRCDVLDEEQMAALGMGALLGVAQGSDQPPRFIILEYSGGEPKAAPYVIVGKGITFDSGGISLKPGEGMHLMKNDMAGAAATLGVLRAVALLKLPIHVVGLIAATENLPSGKAYKPGDVLKSLSGLTIEVISTDAEGRLILADALTYAKRYQPRAVVDLATLTGGCVVALGRVASGLMGTDEALIQALRQAAEESGEKTWPLPLYDEYAEQIKSEVADLKNSGGREASPIIGGMFLKRFAEGYPWAHVDIAGMVWSEKAQFETPQGATGYGVRLLCQWLRHAARQAPEAADR